MASFGKRLKILRDKKGISQEDLAKLFNLSQSTIAYYEKDKKQPSQKTLTRLADYFGVSTDYLLGRSLSNKNAVLPLGEAKEIPIYSLEPKNSDEIFAQENVIGWEPISADLVATIAILINDDSMAGSRISSGDRVIVCEQKTFEDGQTILVQLPDKSMLIRKATHTHDGIILSPSNPAYNPQHFKVKDLAVIGIVIQVHFDYI